MLDADRYDVLVPGPWRSAALCPGARSALVVASGGRALWDALQRSGGARGPDPVDDHTRRALQRAVTSLGAVGHASRALFAHEQRGGVHADFVALARAAGLGFPSRLGLLLHPVCGPWLSIRALLLTRLALPPDRPLDGAGPCASCPAPCLEACPGGAPQATGFDREACDRARQGLHRETCRATCGARRACPLGADHAYTPEAEAHHMRSLAAERRRDGAGASAGDA